MRAPRFWARPPASPGWQAWLLAPLAALWTLVTRLRLARPPAAELRVPVICIGNLTAGGAGKTPMVIALVEHLRDRGRAVHVVSRGYGGALSGPVLVDERVHQAADVGDEPLLLAGFGPVWVGRDRAAAGRAAAAAGAGVVVMDDGFQNPSLARDLSILVVDAGFGFGNGRVIPAGPLREPVTAGLARADLVLAVGSGADRARLLADWPVLGGLPLLEGEVRPLATGMTWRGLRALAFAGIGRPEKFFATLRGLGVELAGTRAFADHAPYSVALVARLEAEARTKRAQLVTTEKDAVRLPAAMRSKVLVLPVRLEIADWRPLDAALAARALCD